VSKLVIIDSHAILHRAYHALPKENFKRQGEPVNAVYGFFSMLLLVISELKPEYLTACFDSPGPNFRHQKFIAYQANRLKTESDLVSQIKLTKKLVEETGMPVSIAPGFEADDIIGTLVKKLRVKNADSKTKGKKSQIDRVIIVTGDKDLMQLVGPKVDLFLLDRGVSGASLIGPKEVKERLGVGPGQVVDYKALVGDSADNYPGVAGVGPKTAVNLLSDFSDLNGIYHSLSKIGLKLKQKLDQGREAALLSQELALINQEVPIQFSFKKMVWNKERLLKLQSSLKDLGFRSLVNRIEKKFSPAGKDVQMKLI